MKITCTGCGAEYPIADQRIPPQGLTIKCPRCMKPIPISRPAGTAAAAAAPPPSPPAAPAAHEDGSTRAFGLGAAAAPAPGRRAGKAGFWVRRAGGPVAGPFDEAEIIRQIEQQRLSGNELISRDQQEWEPLIEHEPFAQAAAGVGLAGRAEPPASRIARIPDAMDSGEFPMRRLSGLETSVELPRDLELSGADLEHALAAGRSDNPPPASLRGGSLGGVSRAPDDGIDLPVPFDGNGVDLPAPALAGEYRSRRWEDAEDQIELPAPAGDSEAELPAPWASGPSQPELPAPVDVDVDDLPLPAEGLEAELPYPADREPHRPPPDFSDEVDLLVPDEADIDLPEPARGRNLELPQPARNRGPELPVPSRGRGAVELPHPAQGKGAELPAPFGGRGPGAQGRLEDEQVDLLAPLEQDADLPAPLQFTPEEDLHDWADRAVSLGPDDADDAGEGGRPGEDATRITALGEDVGRPSEVEGLELDATGSEVALPPRPGGGFRVSARPGAPNAGHVDLDATHLPHESLARPEFVPHEAPRLDELAPLPQTTAEPPGMLRLGLLAALVVLGLGAALGFTIWGFFGIGLFIEEPATPVSRATVRSDGSAPAGPGGDPATAEAGPGSGAGSGTGAAAGSAAPAVRAEIARINGIPLTDSWLGYQRVLGEMKRVVFSPRGSDKDRCAFALTAGLYMMRYGHDEAHSSQARKALEDTSGDTDETALYLLAEIALDLAAGKTEQLEERLNKALELDGQNVEGLVLKAELLISRKDYAPAVQALRQAMMQRNGDPRLTYSLAKAMLLDGKTQEGRQRMAEVLELEEDHPLAMLGVVEELRGKEQYGDAVRLLRKITDLRRPLGPKMVLARAHILSADLLVRQGKSDDALKELTQALVEKPGDVDVLMELAKLYYQRGQYEQAYQQYETINSLGKADLEATIGQIRCLLAQRKLSQANEAIVAARRAWSDNPQLPYYQGIVHEERDKIDRAREEYQAALALDPHFFFPTIKLARLFLREGKKDEALKAMLKAVKENPKAAVLHDGLGELYITLQEMPKAKKSFEKALELDPLLHTARFHLATALINLNEFPAALEQLHRVQSSGNDTLELHYGLARCYQALKRYDQAIEEYNAVLALDPENEEFAFAAGTAYFEKGDYEKARQRFNQALTLDSRLHRAHFLTGQTFLREDNPVQAEKRFRIAVEDFRESIEYSFWLAISLEAQNKMDEAREIYFGIERVTSRNPARLKEVPDLNFRLGRNILISGQPGKAAVYLTRALSKKERRAEPWYLAGEALYQLNMYEKSLQFFRQAVALKRDFTDAHYKMAMASLLEPRTNRGQAIEHFREVINFDKAHQHTDAYKHLGYLYRDGGQTAESVQMLQQYLRLAGASSPDRLEVRREIEALSSQRSGRAVPPPPGRRPPPPAAGDAPEDGAAANAGDEE